MGSDRFAQKIQEEFLSERFISERYIYLFLRPRINVIKVFKRIKGRR